MKLTRKLSTTTVADVLVMRVRYRKAPRLCFFSAVYRPGPCPTGNHRGESRPASAVASHASWLIQALDSENVTPMKASGEETRLTATETMPAMLRPKS